MKTSKLRLSAGLGIGTLVAGAAMLTGCSAGSSPLALDGAPQAKAVPAVSVGDSSGCSYVPPTNANPAGYNCGYVGTTSTFTIPAGEGITEMTVNLAGGQGGNADPASGGYGGSLATTVPVTGGDTISVNVGGGASENTAGTNPVAAADGGNAGCTDGGAGGAATFVEVNGTTVAVAGGGGGGGAQGFAPDFDDGGIGGTPATDNGNGSGGDGDNSGGHGSGGQGGASLSAGGNGPSGKDTGGCGGGGGAGWRGGYAGGYGGFGGGGGGGAGAGGSYAEPSATGTSTDIANGGGDGSAAVAWN